VLSCFWYSLREMNVRWVTTRLALLLQVLAIFSLSTPPQQRNVEAAEIPSRLRFGQSVVLSDFDADGLIDEARLDGSSAHRSVGVMLSGTGKLSVLHFDTRSVSSGALIAEDVDNDGAPDLIWTDLLRADSVIVWRGDGGGEFERSPDCAHCGGFTLGETNVAVPAGANQETAINVETSRPFDQTLSQKGIDPIATDLPNHDFDLIETSSPSLSQPAERGPPYILS
jgi:hypothetical protein